MQRLTPSRFAPSNIFVRSLHGPWQFVEPPYIQFMQFIRNNESYVQLQLPKIQWQSPFSVKELDQILDDWKAIISLAILTKHKYRDIEICLLTVALSQETELNRSVWTQMQAIPKTYLRIATKSIVFILFP